MNKLKSRIGMTMAEMLIVVAIIAVLGGVAFISVWNHQRSLGQLERDGIAKEIFVAAQNHLTAAFGEGYLGLEEPESNSAPNPFGSKDSTGAYYYVVNSSDSSYSTPAVFEQMLPFGSVDETVRAGGSYIVRYQKETGTVMDVFYCSTSGSPAQYNHLFFDSDDYSTVISKAGDENKSARRTYVNGSILGWHGGAEAATLATTTLNPPTITVHNEEKLYVEVTNTNSSNSAAQLKLIITGVDSKAQKAYELKFAGSNDDRVKYFNSSSFTVILDDISDLGTGDGLHFGNIVADTESTTGEKFIPGENIEIQAVAYSTTALTNIAYSSKYTTNSLFGSINTAKDTAYIGNIRHLENLDKGISSLDANDGTGTKDKLKIAHAEQTDSFSWIGYQKAVKKIESKSNTGTESDSGYALVGIYDFNRTNSGAGYYMPIEPNYALTYNGKSRSISDVAVNVTGDGGLFGSISSVTEIKNLELIDFSITGMTSAGALAGKLSGCTVTNVLARNSAATSAAKITATGNAGGLVGELTSGTVQYSAAAVIVGDPSTKPTNAGGLIGSAGGTITGCYSGGHTLTGSYEEWVKIHPYDVTGTTAGGLVGISSAAITDSYSTCSVSGTTAGGFAGNASGIITNCYATGYIDPNATTKYAFVAGTLSSSSTGNWYYRTINEVEKEGGKPGETEPMLPYQGAGEVSSHLGNTKPIDLNAGTYNVFVGEWDTWNPARAFDSALVKYYSGSYTLRTVDELNLSATLPTGYSNWNELFVKTHYGDWPSPEVFFINTSE